MNNLVKKLGFERIPPEKKYYSAVPGLLNRIKNLYENICDIYGDDGLELIRKNSKEYGLQIGKRINSKGEVKGIRDVGCFILKVFDNVAENWEVTHFDDDRLVIEVPRCPYTFESEALCKAHIQMEKSLIETLDDSLDYRVGKSIPAGDRVCEHILLRK